MVKPPLSCCVDFFADSTVHNKDMLLTLAHNDDFEFSDSTRKKGGEFYIPHLVVRMDEQWEVVARMTAPKDQLAAQARCAPVWREFNPV